MSVPVTLSDVKRRDGTRIFIRTLVPFDLERPDLTLGNTSGRDVFLQGHARCLSQGAGAAGHLLHMPHGMTHSN